MIDSPDIISLDTETFWAKKLKYSVRTLLPEFYAAHPLFDCFLVSVCNGKTAWAGHPTELNWEALEGAVLLSHNARFDQAIIKELIKRGIIPKFTPRAWHCTANMSAYLWNRRALADAVKRAFNIELSKSARDDSEGKHWPNDYTEAQRANFLEYARSDVVWCRRLFIEHGDRWPEHERRISELTIRRGVEGIRINRELLDDYLIRAHDMRMQTEKQLPWLADTDDADEDWGIENPKPTSTKAIAEMCRRSGIPACPVKSDDEDIYQAWEDTYAPTHLWIGAVTAWRSINKLQKTLQTIKDRLRDDDGTMPYSLKYFGAHTGRMSGDGKLNMQNFPREPYLTNEHGLLEKDDRRIKVALELFDDTGLFPDWVRGSIDLRNLLIARPGKKFIISDLSQIEARIVNWLAGNREMLALVRSGVSVYEAFARACLGWIGGDLKTENKKQYAMAKAMVLGLGFGCGWEKFITVAMKMAGVDVAREDPEFVEQVRPITGERKIVSGWGTNSKRIVKTFRDANPKIVALWRALDDNFRRSIASDFCMTLPSGRVMRYEKVRGETRIEPDKETGLPRRKSVYTAEIGGRRTICYGGLLTENITQACARDVFMDRVLALEDAGISVLLTIHDEVITEVDLDTPTKTVHSIMTTSPAWMPDLPLGADVVETLFYKK